MSYDGVDFIDIPVHYSDVLSSADLDAMFDEYVDETHCDLGPIEVMGITFTPSDILNSDDIAWRCARWEWLSIRLSDKSLIETNCENYLTVGDALDEIQEYVRFNGDHNGEIDVKLLVEEFERCGEVDLSRFVFVEV